MNHDFCKQIEVRVIQNLLQVLFVSKVVSHVVQVL